MTNVTIAKTPPFSVVNMLLTCSPKVTHLHLFSLSTKQRANLLREIVFFFRSTNVLVTHVKDMCPCSFQCFRCFGCYAVWDAS